MIIHPKRTVQSKAVVKNEKLYNVVSYSQNHFFCEIIDQKNWIGNEKKSVKMFNQLR